MASTFLALQLKSDSDLFCGLTMYVFVAAISRQMISDQIGHFETFYKDQLRFVIYRAYFACYYLSDFAEHWFFRMKLGSRWFKWLGSSGLGSFSFCS